jgi:hypothetical protein
MKKKMRSPKRRGTPKKGKRHRQNSNELTIGPPWVHVEPSHWLHEIFVSKLVCHRLFTWLDAKPWFFGGFKLLITSLKFGDQKLEKEKPLIYFHFQKKSPWKQKHWCLCIQHHVLFFLFSSMKGIGSIVSKVRNIYIYIYINTKPHGTNMILQT